MGYRSFVRTKGCSVVYLLDDFGRLLQMWAAPDPMDFRVDAAKLVAALRDES